MVQFEEDMRLLTSEEAAELLGVHVNTLATWRDKGEGPAYIRFGSGTRAPIKYRMRDINEWLEKQTVRPEN